jgi:hypothetical protein
VGLKLNGTHQLLFYADDVNILDGSIYTMRKNTENLVIASKEMGLEVNTEKTKYMVMSGDQNAGKNGSIHRSKKLFQTIEQFKYLGTDLMNQNSIHEEIEEHIEIRKCLFFKRLNGGQTGLI